MTPALALCGLLMPWAAAAQKPGEPPDSPREEHPEGKPEEPRGHPGPRPPGKGGTSPAEPAPEEIRVRAETQGGEKGHYWFRGFVDLQAGDTRIQADKADLYETDTPQGRSRKLVAEGNVVFLQGEERLAGERLTMDLATNRGTFEHALGYVQPGVFVEGKTIERVDADTYRVEGARFTSCSQPSPRWGFTASSARIEVEDKIVAKNVVLRVKDVPAFYVPYFLYPIREDQRSTGFLFPHFGYSSTRGFNVGTGFFWAMGRSLDQTFYADRYSKFGYGLGHELRYLAETPSRGTFKSYAFRPENGGDWDYDLDWRANQRLPGKIRANLAVRQYSNLLFQQRIQDNLNLASTRSKRSSLSLHRSFGATTVQALADANDYFFGDQTRVNRHLPTLRVAMAPHKIGRRSGIVFGYEARAENLARGDQVHVDSFSRIDAAPEVSRPFAASFLQFTPRLALRYTRYGATEDPERERRVVGPPLDRAYLESALELRGPNFSRVFNQEGGFYSDRFKHVIGPEVTWRYRSPVHDFDVVPKFDFVDQYLGTNQIDYALVQRFLAKRRGPAGKLVPYEFLSWRIAQTYYVQINDNQNEFDPNYTSLFFSPGGVPDHNSPLQSRVRFRPTPVLSSNFNLEYDVNFKQVRRLDLSANANYRRAGVQATWSRSRRTAARVENRVLLYDTIRGSGRLEVLPKRLSVDGGADYDILRKKLIQSQARVRYDVQCCGFTAEAIQSHYNQRDERQFRFSIQLANIGSVGNFMGEEPDKPRQGLGAAPPGGFY